MGVVGAALRGFGKALKYHKAQRSASKKVHKNFQTGRPFPQKTQEHIRGVEKRKLEMKHKGFKQEPYRVKSVRKNKKGDDVIKLKEVWSKAKGGKV